MACRSRVLSCRGGFTAAASLLFVGILLVFGPSRALAAEGEMREFNVQIDGKSAGQYHMAITRQDDGSTTVTGYADVKTKINWVYNYTYTIKITEVWKDGRLQRLESTTNDDGKGYAVTAVAEGDTLRVTANGQERVTRPDVWATTYWHTPDARFNNQGVPLLDSDTGKEFNALLKPVGNSRINVNGQMQDCAHYKLTGAVQVEVWYDAQGRLVREESVEDGHRFVLDLARIKR